MEELCDAEWSEVVAPAVEGFESFLGPLLQAPIANGTIGYRRFGNTRSNRPALIMATGFGQTMGSWADGTLRTLAQSQEVIIFDHRGMGQSAVRRSGGGRVSWVSTAEGSSRQPFQHPLRRTTQTGCCPSMAWPKTSCSLCR